MHREKIIELTQSVFVEDFELELQQLVPDANLFTELGLDSLDVVDLVVALQKKFGVSIRDNERIREVRTLSDLYDLLEVLGAELESE